VVRSTNGRIATKKLQPGSKKLGVVVVSVRQLTLPGVLPDVNAAGRDCLVEPQADLPEVVAALRAAGRLAGALDGRQQQADQRGDDGDHDEQLDEREAASHDRVSQGGVASGPPHRAC
jgi:hypothetical protein